MRRAALVAVVFASACAGAGTTAPPLSTGDLAAFAATVQPVLDTRCADPSCHGRPERPFSIYSPTRYRRDAARTFLIEPLAADELGANATVLTSFAVDAREAGESLDGCLVLCKPLPASAGGCRHVGGAVFASPADPEHRALRDFIAALPCERGP